jgi:HD-GYP domain-containing protein (c-di-GMP phosphodiesterase class II)
MNLSMVDFQDSLKEQNAPLTPAQREQLEHHPSDTCKMLTTAGVTDIVWLRAIAEHHEHVDGSGYPARLKRETLGPGGQLLCLADVFCARVTPAVYRPAVASNMALRSILLERGKSFDPVLAGQFIKALGVFPPGLLVRLANGEIGIVAKMGETPNYPVVASIVGAQGVPLTIALRRDTSQEGYGIVETVDPKTFSTYVNMESIWGVAASMN